jgi:hypothetical protein
MEVEIMAKERFNRNPCPQFGQQKGIWGILISWWGVGYDMNREQGYQLVCLHVKNKNLVKHMLAVEAVMGALARRLGEDEEL